MSIHFRPLFEVEVAHGYYAEPSADLAFEVPAATPALAAGKLLVRVRDGRLIVLFEADEGGLPLRDIAGETLLIGLNAVNPYLANFTAAPVPAGSLPLFINRSQPRLLETLAAHLVADRQRVNATLPGRPLSLRWRLGTRLIAEQMLLAGQSVAEFATRDWPAGCYTLSEEAGGPPSVSQWVLHPELAGRRPWGVLAVTVAGAFYADPPRFSVSLSPRREQLKYYVVARNYGSSEFGQLNVNDAGAGEQGRPPLVFDRVEADDFAADDLPPEVLGDAGARVVLFQSRGETDRRAGGYRKLQLRRNNEVLVQHLPQAGSDRAQARFIVHLAKS
jgi:hypothetical protein